MKNYNKCEICKTWHWLDKECPPIFYFKHEHWGEDFQKIRAHHMEDAAIEFAKKYNEDGDYSLMNNSEKVIISDGKTEKEFIVSAEQDVHYRVKEAN